MLMLFVLVAKPYNWTTDTALLAWVGVISLVLGVLSILVSWWFNQTGKVRRQLTYSIISDIPIIKMLEQPGSGKIKVSYEDKSGHIEDVNSAKLLTLRLWNSGNQDIKIWSSEDQDVENIEEPIIFEFGKRTVVTLTQVKTEPPGKVTQPKHLSAYLDTSTLMRDCLGFPRSLLKPDQAIELSILLNGAGSEVKLRSGRLLNGEIIDSREIVRRKRPMQIVIIGISAVLYLCMIVASYFTTGQCASPPWWVIAGLVIGALGFLFSGMIIPKKYRVRRE